MTYNWRYFSMRIKIDEFDKHYLVCNFSRNEYLNMLIGNMSNETKEKIINSFIRFLREKKTVSERTLEAMMGKFNRILYKETIRSVESFLFFDNNDEESVKNYLKNFTFNEYSEIVFDCFSCMKDQYIGKKSRMLKKGYCNFREIFFDRVYHAVCQMAYNVKYLKDVDKAFKNPYPDKAFRSIIDRMTRTTIATVVYDRGTNLAKSKSADPRNLEFFKLDTRRMHDYVDTAQMRNLPYNIESLLSAASSVFEFAIDMECTDLDILNAPMEMKFYESIKGISDEIINRAHIDMGIEISNSHTKSHVTEECDKNSSSDGDNKVISGNENGVLKDDDKTNEKKQVRPRCRRTHGNEIESKNENETDDADTSSDEERE